MTNGIDCCSNQTCWKQPSPFSNVHLRNTTKIAVQVLALDYLLSLLLSLFTNEASLKL